MKFKIYILIIITYSIIIFLGIKLFCKTEKTVFVDLQKVYKEFKLKSEVEKEAESIIQTRQLLLDSLLTDLQSKEQVVTKNKDKEIERNFEKDKDNYLKKKQYFENSNQNIIEHYNSKIWEELQRLSIDYAKEEGFDMILGKGGSQSFVYGNDKLDCTNKFIEYINQHYDKNKK